MERVFYVKGDLGQFVTVPSPLSHFSFPVFTSAIKRHCGIINPYTLQEFVDCYAARKRRDYDIAREDVELGRLKRSHAYISAFGKVEKTNFTAKPDAVQRVVSPRDKRYNICVGRFLKPMEHRIYEAINSLFGSVSVMKGLNFHQRAAHLFTKWSRFKRPAAIRGDAKRFDQHVSVEALRYEHSVYLSLCPKEHRSELSKLLSWQLSAHSFVRTSEGNIHYTIEGTRASGDMNTALGNVVIMCTLIHEFARTLSIDLELADDGDDFVIIVEAEDVPRVLQYMNPFFITFGFEMDVGDPTYKFEEMVLCQCQPVYDGEQWVMVRQPQIGIMKDISSMIPSEFVLPDGSLNPHNRLLRVIGLGGLSLAQGIPIYDTLYKRFVQLGSEGCFNDPRMEIGFMIHSRLMREERINKQITEEARVSFHAAFGIEPAMQILMEEELAKWNPLRSPLILNADPSSLEALDPFGIPI
jgi:hypothetical protein